MRGPGRVDGYFRAADMQNRHAFTAGFARVVADVISNPPWRILDTLAVTISRQGPHRPKPKGLKGVWITKAVVQTENSVANRECMRRR